MTRVFLSPQARLYLAAALLGWLVAVILFVDQPEASAQAPPRLLEVEVGQNHACVLRASLHVTCWGDDSSGQVSDWGKYRYENHRFSSISAGGFLTCGIRIAREGTDTDDSVMCWGYPEQENGSHAEANNQDWNTWAAMSLSDRRHYGGWVNTPPQTVKFQGSNRHALSVGNYHACGIQKNGEIACWGKAGDARLVVPTENGQAITDWRKVEVGWANACGVRESGDVLCWGRSSWGRSAGPAATNKHWMDVTLGVYNGCALAADGSVECWGAVDPDPNQDRLAVLAPLKQPPDGVKFDNIEMATEQTHYYACGLERRSREVRCWGVAGALQRAPLPGSWALLSVGGNASCALDYQDRLGCWGASDNGLFSPPAGRFKQTDGGRDFSCAIKSDDTVVCWGGIGYAADFPTTDTFKHLAVGAFHACAIKSDDTVACWGGVQSAGPPVARLPYAIAPAGTFKAISAGTDLTCAIRDGQNSQTDGELHCWGATTHSRQTEPSGSFTHVAVGHSHVCAIRADKSIACWGQALFFDTNGDGAPDDIGGKGNHTSTTPPSGSHQYTDISAGEAHNCAIRTDKKAVCWGYHADSRQAVPGFEDDAQGFGDHDYIDIATGGLPNCAIYEGSGSLSCWNNEKRQYLPSAEIRSMTGFKSLGAGAFHICAVGMNDGLVCWGAGNVIPFPADFRSTTGSPPSSTGPTGGAPAQSSDATLTAPTGVAATVNGSDVTITWTDGENAVRHAVILFTTDYEIGGRIQGNPSGNSVTFSNVPSGSYIAVVVALDSAGDDFRNMEIDFAMVTVP